MAEPAQRAGGAAPFNGPAEPAESAERVGGADPPPAKMHSYELNIPMPMLPGGDRDFEVNTTRVLQRRCKGPTRSSPPGAGSLSAQHGPAVARVRDGDGARPDAADHGGAADAVGVRLWEGPNVNFSCNLSGSPHRASGKLACCLSSSSTQAMRHSQFLQRRVEGSLHVLECRQGIRTNLPRRCPKGAGRTRRVLQTAPPITGRLRLTAYDCPPTTG